MRMHKQLSAERLSHKHDVYPQELTQLLMEKISRRSCLLTPLPPPPAAFRLAGCM